LNKEIKHLNQAIVFDAKLFFIERCWMNFLRIVWAVFALESSEVAGQTLWVKDGAKRAHLVVSLANRVNLARVLGTTAIAPLWP
jgi:hypothetical protein